MAAPPLRRAGAPAAVTLAAALAAAVWAAWLLALGRAGCWGAAAHAGCPRVDFSAFWGAGRLVDAGRAADAYAWPLLHAELERAFGLRGIAPLPFLYPPPALLAAAPLGSLPYAHAFVVWTAAGGGAYAAAAWAVLRRPAAWAVACAPAGVFYCAFAGQTGFLTAAALAGGLLCLDARPRLAGVLFALFACKPQLALLAPVALAAEGRWRVLALAAATYVLLLAAAAAALGPSVAIAFLHGVAGGGGAFAGEGWLPWWKVQSLYGALRGAGLATPLAAAAQVGLALGAAAAVWRLWRGPASRELKAAGLSAAALVASPYGFVYDGPLLAMAALFLLRDGGRAPLTALQGALLAGGLFGQVAFLVAPGSLVTPVAALALLAATAMRAGRASRAGAGYAAELAASAS